MTQSSDWAQVLARKGATLVAGTGFQYGDDELIEYSERVYAEFAHQLRVGTGSVAVGQALVQSKLAYLAATPQIQGMHEKALLTASVFGLPMFSVNMPGTRDTSSSAGSTVTTNDALGVSSSDLHLTNTQFAVPATPTAGPDGTTYFSGANGVASNPGEPALPRYVANVDVTSKVLRGVGFRAGTYTETSGVKPYIGAPGTEFGGSQTPFTSTTFYPARMWAASYFADISGGATSLVVTPEQHRVANIGDTTATRRLYSSLDLRLFYADATDANAKVATAPAISNITAAEADGVVTFSARATGSDLGGTDNVKAVWVTYTYGATGCSCWAPVDLAPSDADPTVWTGTLNVGAADASALRFMVQAANGAALVGIDDNDAAYYAVPTVIVSTTPAPSTLQLDTPPASAAYGSTVNVSATLGGVTDLGGKTITFRVGTSVAYGTTNLFGFATAALKLLAEPGQQQIVATFAPEGTVAGSTDQAPITVIALSTQLTLSLGAGSLAGTASGISATLKSDSTPLAGRTVTFVATGTGAAVGQGFVRSVTTDASGVASLGPTPAVPPVTYTLTAYFGGTFDLHPWSPPSATIAIPDDPVYDSSSTSGTMIVRYPFTGFFAPVDNMPVLNVAKAGSTVPVKFSLGGDRGLGILAANSPKRVPISCSSAPLTDAVESTTLDAGGLKYTGGQYQWNWKSSKSDIGCWRLDLILVDGQMYSANFQFK